MTSGCSHLVFSDLFSNRSLVQRPPLGGASAIRFGRKILTSDIVVETGRPEKGVLNYEINNYLIISFS